ncbi:MAG: UDP-3-O-(3-hydroxymyristoyl)glucosamine N-acyltransferase [bacterium]
MRTWKLGRLAHFLGGEASGNPEKELTGTCSLEFPHPEKLAFLEDAKQIELLNQIMLGAAIMPPEVAHYFPDAILHSNPRLAFAWAQVAFLAPDSVALPPKADLTDSSPWPFTGGEWRSPIGIHPQASVSGGAQVHQSAEVGAFSRVEEGAKIGAGTILYPFVWVGKNASLGENCRIFPFVSIYPESVIGNRVFIHSGTAVGSDGFGFVSHRGGHTKFPQTGRVVIEDDVEIGANCAIDRAAIDDTVVEEGAKLDNLIQIAHGVRIGRRTLVAAQAGISGGTRIGRWCVIGGQAGITGHANIGDQAVIGAQAGVIGDLDNEAKVSGYPARPHQQAMRSLAALARLPEHLTELEALKRKVRALEDEIKSIRGG